MVRKLMKLMTSLKTGQNSILLVLMVTLLSSCWSRHYDYSYSKKISNSTSDTLLLLLGKDGEAYPVDSILIMPTSEFTFDGTPGIDKKEDPVKRIFSGGYRPFEEQARVYRNDSLKVTWDGPAREMADSIHHFYNYNSWESWVLDESQSDERYGVVMFTIYDSDLKD